MLEARLDGREVAPVVLGTGTLRRAVRDGLVAADLRIAIERPTTAELDLVVDDGDNAPLELTAVRAVFAQEPWIYFETTSPGAVVARFGSPKLAAPHYDLEAVRGGISARRIANASWGEVAPNANTGALAEPLDDYPLEGGSLDRQGFTYSRPITAGKHGLNAVLLDAAVLAHAHGWAGLRIVDGEGHQVPYLLEKRDEPLAVELPITSESAHDAGIGDKESRYRITLPYATLPQARLLVSSPSHVFERQLRLLAEQVEPAPPRAPPMRTLEETHWSHRDPETPAPPVSFELPATGVDRVFLEIEEGDNRLCQSVAQSSCSRPSAYASFESATAP